MSTRMESRGTVTEANARDARDAAKKQQELTATREDKERVAATAADLSQAGTREGREAVARAMARVGERVDRHMEKRGREAEEIEHRLDEAGTELRQAERQTESDAREIRGAERRIRERESGAEAAMDEAAVSSDVEAQFLAESATEAERIRMELAAHREREAALESDVRVSLGERKRPTHDTRKPDIIPLEGHGAHVHYWPGGWHLRENLPGDLKVDYDISADGEVLEVSQPRLRKKKT